MLFWHWDGSTLRYANEFTSDRCIVNGRHGSITAMNPAVGIQRQEVFYHVGGVALPQEYA